MNVIILVFGARVEGDLVFHVLVFHGSGRIKFIDDQCHMAHGIFRLPNKGVT